MPYKVEFSEKPFGLITKFFGVVTDDELRQSCIDRTSSDEQIKKLAYILDDFSDVSDFAVTSEAVINAASFAVKASELNNNIKFLSIMPTDLLYGMTRMWHAYTDETQWERNIVRTREEAEQWMKNNGFKN